MRIVSLVPSQTELLHSLGLEDEVVGITKFCIHPSAWFRTKTRVGGTKNLHPETIDALKPDLILANKEENDRQQVEALASRYTTWVSDVKSLPDALDMIRTVGNLTHRNTQAQSLADEIRRRFDTLIPISGSPTTAYLIWRDPYMAAGGDTFIHDMLRRCGLTNALAAVDRYPIVDTETLSRCNLILLSSEPYPFREKHIDELKQLLPSSVDIALVDGQIFSWYGSRLLEAPAYFSQLQNSCLPPAP
jgi:ABC-type Fe3+-hydroxamate transport system substrate-binding protein